MMTCEITGYDGMMRYWTAYDGMMWNNRLAIMLLCEITDWLWWYDVR